MSTLPWLRAQVGRAEPDDLRGWMEQGGLLALQRGLAQPGPTAPGPAPLTVTVGTGDRWLAEELPAWLLVGALLAARQAGQPSVTVALDPALPSTLAALLRDVLGAMQRLGIAGATGWGSGVALKIAHVPGTGQHLSGTAAAGLASQLAAPPTPS